MLKIPLKPTNCVTTSFSLPKQIMDELNATKGDIPRSRYVLRLLEEALRSREKKK